MTTATTAQILHFNSSDLGIEAAEKFLRSSSNSRQRNIYWRSSVILTTCSSSSTPLGTFRINTNIWIYLFQKIISRNFSSFLPLSSTELRISSGLFSGWYICVIPSLVSNIRCNRALIYLTSAKKMSRNTQYIDQAI